MKKKNIIIIIIIFIAVVSTIYNIKQNIITKESKVAQHIPPGSTMPDFLLKDIASDIEIALTTLKGKVIFINFWASWCKPCRDEMDSINNLYNIMRRKNDFRLITILYKEKPETSTRYLQDSGYVFPVYVDKLGTTPEKFGITGVPETYIFNKQGILKHVRLGPARWDSAENIKLITLLLDE